MATLTMTLTTTAGSESFTATFTEADAAAIVAAEKTITQNMNPGTTVTNAQAVHSMFQRMVIQVLREVQATQAAAAAASVNTITYT